jgi:gamma-glutamyltranspeptidase
MTFTTRPELRGTFGMVASTHWLASAAGMAVLERGGNAFDAAAATGFTLQVVEPHLNGPGGDLPVVAWSRGHIVDVTDDWSLGRVSAVGRENGVLKAGANPRGMQGYAVGR